MGMKKMYISINGIHDTLQFVKQATLVDGDIICRRGRHVFDGKSAIGMFNINISEGIIVEYPDTAVEFENYISQFRVHKVGI